MASRPARRIKVTVNCAVCNTEVKIDETVCPECNTKIRASQVIDQGPRPRNRPDHY